ncbi:beta-lactamase hydrolase domain-containing protein [Thorsellia kenyensis]|uniref:Beta-lactamase hydrolase domain-containing protein n=1 Tax=Thorsellia kenyensis TaxID=1549888 RepID=A0ABV6CF59_9GAMM
MNNSLPNLLQLTETLFVHSALEPNDMQHVANAGFKSVIINLPDYELGENQATASSIMTAARALGLEIIYQPVVTKEMTHHDCKLFHNNIAKLPSPVLAFCSSGNRCTLLFNGIIP